MITILDDGEEGGGDDNEDDEDDDEKPKEKPDKKPEEEKPKEGPEVTFVTSNNVIPRDGEIMESISTKGECKEACLDDDACSGYTFDTKDKTCTSYNGLINGKQHNNRKDNLALYRKEPGGKYYSSFYSLCGSFPKNLLIQSGYFLT